MSSQYLDKTGLAYFWGKIKDYIEDQLSDLSGEIGLVSTYDSVTQTVTLTAGVIEDADNTEY